jgi:hypothetical protein
MIVMPDVAVIDIGSTKKRDKPKTGWAIDGPTSQQHGYDIEEFIDSAAPILRKRGLALGFEAPMFVPLHSDANDLTRKRQGEGDRAFTASPGATALVVGLVVIPYVLKKLREHASEAEATFSWREWRPNGGQLLLFEAFVTHQPPDDPEPHVRDAKLAIQKFREAMNQADFSCEVYETENFNLLGAALLRTGWTRDVAVLSMPCLVIRHKGTFKRKNRVSARSI